MKRGFKLRPIKELHREIDSWAWAQLRDRVLELLAEEPEFVGTHARFEWPKTPLEFIKRYDIDDDDSVMYSLQDINIDKEPVKAIQRILYNAPSWGEFVGGVIGAAAQWKPGERSQVLPYLNTAVQKALTHGVDH